MTESEEPRNGQPDPVELLLGRIRSGDAKARDELLPLVYRELHRKAQQEQRDPSHTLQATALVHEAYVRLFRSNGAGWTDKLHFYRAAAKAMRSAIVDHSRNKNAIKRRGPDAAKRIDLELLGDLEDNSLDLLALNEALDQLRKLDPDLLQLVELRFFAGRTFEECAQLLGIAERTVRRHWKIAKAKLQQFMGIDGEDQQTT